MIRSKARLVKSLSLSLLLASAASVASASELADKLRARVEQHQEAKSAALGAAKDHVAQQAAQARQDRPARNADRGDRDRGRRDGNRVGDHRRSGGDRDRNRDRGRFDNDRRGSGRGGEYNRDRGRSDRGQSDGRRWDNDRRDSRRWDNDRRHSRNDGRRWDNDRRDSRRWDNDRRGSHHGRYRPHYGHGYRHHSRHAWHGSSWRNGFYYQSGRFLNFSFSIPSLLAVDWPTRYDQYYYGNVYYPGLGDYVEVFLFPVYYGSYVEYVPYAYYDGQLYGRGRMLSGGPNVSFHFDF
jgi:hypothetical protein